MKDSTFILLIDAWEFCDREDKSTEFMIEYMKSVAKVDNDCVMGFLMRYKSWKHAEKALDEKK